MTEENYNQEEEIFPAEEEEQGLTPEQLAYLQQQYYKDMGFFEKRQAKIKNAWAIRRAIMEREKAYFSSEESDPARIEAQKARNREALGQLKIVGFIVLGFLIFYLILRIILFW